MEQLISVIIPCYNSASSIHRAIKSVINQGYANIEIIVVDDASDDTAILKSELDSFADKRIRYFRHEFNKKGSAARNTGIMHSTGSYISFLDADDEWYPDHLNCSLTHLSQLDSDNCVVYCRNLVKTMNNPDIVMPQVGIRSNERVSEYLFCSAGYMSTPSLFASAGVFKATLFNEGLVRHQDYELLLRLDSKGCKFSLSEHTGVIVHWENNDTAKKGGTPQFSFDFAKQYRCFFTSKSYTGFVLKNVVFPFFIARERIKGLRILLSNCNPFLMSLKNWIFCFDYFVWGRLNLVKLFTGR